MKYLINTTYLSDSQKRNENVELSSSCPCCGVSLFPDLLYAVCVDHDDMEEDIVYTFNHCQNCDECFISKHPFDEENGDGFIYASSSPVKSCEQNFSEAITSLSPNFVSIYKQAALAESLGLDQICGIGYRKAIEFLVKDYNSVFSYTLNTGTAMPSIKRKEILMKFDPNLIRDILISVSESISPDEYGFVSQIYPVDIAQNKLSDYSQNEVLYWIRQLMNSGILIEGSKYVDEPISHIKDLSLAGYQFIENTSKSSVWKEIRPQLISATFSNLPSFIQCAIELSGKLISKCSDIHLQ